MLRSILLHSRNRMPRALRRDSTSPAATSCPAAIGRLMPPDWRCASCATFLLGRYLAATTGTAISFADAAHSWPIINRMPRAIRRRSRVVCSDPLPAALGRLLPLDWRCASCPPSCSATAWPQPQRRRGPVLAHRPRERTSMGAEDARRIQMRISAKGWRSAKKLRRTSAVNSQYL